jgi:phosphoglycolate phosphatase
MIKIRTINWDFDGTQARTLEVLKRIGHELSRKYAGIDFTEEDVEYLRGLDAKEVARVFFKGLLPSNKSSPNGDRYVSELIRDLKANWKLWFLLPRILHEGQRDFKAEHTKIEPYDGIIDVIKQLSQEDYENITLTSNHNKTVYSIYQNWNLHCIGVYHCTTFLGLPSLFGKTQELKRIMRERGFRKHRADPRQTRDFKGHKSGMWKYDTDKMIYIGDEARDVHACQRLGVRMLGVTWGLNNAEALTKAGLSPNYLVNTPQEIPGKIKDLESELLGESYIKR